MRRVPVSTVMRVALILIAGILSPSARSDSPIDLTAYQGKVVYLDFWASWCAPCRKSFPWMDTLQSAYRNQGLVVIGVNVDQERPLAERFLGQMSPHFQIVFDPAGTLAERFKVTGMPTSFIIDRHGAVRFTHQGFRDERTAQLDSEIGGLLAEK
jgi:thiol-disulfide isomerase/thioredoxin